jgi:hypothetical protein
MTPFFPAGTDKEMRVSFSVEQTEFVKPVRPGNGLGNRFSIR